MSPVRVLISDENGNQRILECMMHTDKDTGAKSMYIVEKRMLISDEESGPLSPRSIAYSMITSRNSDILRKYNVYKSESGKSYSVDGISGTFYILQECMQAATYTYCESENYNILKVM